MPDDYTRWATALIEDWLPEVTAGLMEPEGEGSPAWVIDAVELRRRDALVQRLQDAAKKAALALESMEALLAYEDFKEKA